jgi:hypothetical protein
VKASDAVATSANLDVSRHRHLKRIDRGFAFAHGVESAHRTRRWWSKHSHQRFNPLLVARTVEEAGVLRRSVVVYIIQLKTRAIGVCAIGANVEASRKKRIRNDDLAIGSKYAISKEERPNSRLRWCCIRPIPRHRRPREKCHG